MERRRNRKQKRPPDASEAAARTQAVGPLSRVSSFVTCRNHAWNGIEAPGLGRVNDE